MYFRVQHLILLTLTTLFMMLFGCENRLTNSSDSALELESGINDGSRYISSDAMGLTGDYYPGNEQFGELTYNGFVFTTDDALSTFGSDVDAGSYTFGRKKINEGGLPAAASVRVEEYINYFKQNYTPPIDQPFSVQVDGAPSPFRSENLHLLRIGLQSRQPTDEVLPWNLTFLIDISGSMRSRIDLVKESLYILVDNMRLGDQVSICTYAGSVGTVLMPTSLQQNDAEAIKNIISDLEAGGSTAMASGLQNAYSVNNSAFLGQGVNRIIVCSDGDANVGATSQDEILDLISEYVDLGTTLSTLGFGQGNYNDHLMEQLADRGNGNYYYIDSIDEAERLFTEELLAIMEVIAKDVKIQVEFNPFAVLRYRLIGYENRDIADEDFEDESTDAGEIGAGHRVTAFYEIELMNQSLAQLGTVHLRYKLPDGDTDIAFDVEITPNDLYSHFSQANDRFRFTAGVAEFAEILRESPHANTSLAQVEALVTSSLNDGDERDVELLELIRLAQTVE